MHIVIGRGDVQQLILRLAGILILTFSPSSQRLIIANSHDGRPTRFTTALPAIIFIMIWGVRAIGSILPLMAQPQRVARLMRPDFRRWFADVTDGPARRVAAPVPRAEIRHPRRRDRGGSKATALPTPLRCRLKDFAVRGYVDIERHVIFRDPLPNIFDCRVTYRRTRIGNAAPRWSVVPEEIQQQHCG